MKDRDRELIIHILKVLGIIFGIIAIIIIFVWSLGGCDMSIPYSMQNC